MEYRKFGNTDLLLSEIGFGTWAIGGGTMIGTTAIGWGNVDDYVSKQAILYAPSVGINFFDTADIYGLGHSENLLGETIGSEKTILLAGNLSSIETSAHGKDFVIATKVGNVARNNEFTIDYSKQYIISACETSLKRLKREAIDYYQLHSARLTHLQNGECIEAMEELQKKGMIRYWGLSLNTFDPFPEAEFLIERGLGNGFQLVLNILNQKALPLLKKAASKGYGIIARMPLQFGLLTGKFDNGVSFAANDHRKNRLTPAVFEAANNALKPVWDLCFKYNCSKTEVALSYILSYPEVSTIIPGIRTPWQAEQNTTGLFKLLPEDRLLIESLGTGSFVEVMQLIRQQG